MICPTVNPPSSDSFLGMPSTSTVTLMGPAGSPMHAHRPRRPINPGVGRLVRPDCAGCRMRRIARTAHRGRRPALRRAGAARAACDRRLRMAYAAKPALQALGRRQTPSGRRGCLGGQWRDAGSRGNVSNSLKRDAQPAKKAVKAAVRQVAVRRIEARSGALGPRLPLGLDAAVGHGLVRIRSAPDILSLKPTGPDLPPRAALAEGAPQNAAGGAARRPPWPARRRDRTTAPRAADAEVPGLRHPPKPPPRRRIGFLIGPRRSSHGGHIPISPSVPPRRPTNGPKIRLINQDHSARQAAVPGAVIRSPFPTGVWAIRHPCTRRRQSRLRAALLHQARSLRRPGSRMTPSPPAHALFPRRSSRHPQA